MFAVCQTSMFIEIHMFHLCIRLNHNRWRSSNTRWISHNKYVSFANTSILWIATHLQLFFSFKHLNSLVEINIRSWNSKRCARLYKTVLTSFIKNIQVGHRFANKKHKLVVYYFVTACGYLWRLFFYEYDIQRCLKIGNN